MEYRKKGKGKSRLPVKINEEWNHILNRYQELQKLLDICDVETRHPDVLDQVEKGASKVALELGQIEKEISQISNDSVNYLKNSQPSLLSGKSSNSSTSVNLECKDFDENWFIKKLREQYLEKRESAVSARGEDLFIKMKNNCRPIPNQNSKAQNVPFSKERTHYKISLPSNSRNPNVYYFVKKSKSAEDMKTKSDSTLQQIFTNVDRIKEIVGNYTKKNVTKSMSEILVNPARCYFPEYYEKLNMARSSHKYKIDHVTYSDQKVKCTRCKKVITDQPIVIQKKNLDAATSSFNFKKDQNCQACEDCRQCIDFMRGADSDVLLVNRNCNEKCENDLHQKCTIDSGIMNDLNALSPTKIYCTPCDSISIKAFSVPCDKAENVSQDEKATCKDKICSKSKTRSKDKICSKSSKDVLCDKDKFFINASCSEKYNKSFYRRDCKVQKCCVKETKPEMKAQEILNLLKNKNKVKIEDTNVYTIDLNNITSTRLYAIPFGLMNDDEQKDCCCKRLSAVLPEPEEISKLCSIPSCPDSCKIKRKSAHPEPCDIKKESACPEPCRIKRDSACPEPCRIKREGTPKKVKYSIDKDDCEENVLQGKKECVDLYLDIKELFQKDDKSRRLCSVFDRKGKCVQFKSKDTIFERASERSLNKRGYLEDENIEGVMEPQETEVPSTAAEIPAKRSLEMTSEREEATEAVEAEIPKETSEVAIKRNTDGTLDSIIKSITNEIGSSTKDTDQKEDGANLRSPSPDSTRRSPTKKPFVTKIYHSKGVQVESVDIQDKKFETKSIQYDLEDIGSQNSYSLSPSRYVQTEDNVVSRSHSKGIQYEINENEAEIVLPKNDKSCDSSESCDSLESCLKEYREEKKEEKEFMNKTNKQTMLRNKRSSNAGRKRGKSSTPSPARISESSRQSAQVGLKSKPKKGKKRGNKKIKTKVLRDTLNYVALTQKMGVKSYRRSFRQPCIVVTEFKNFPDKEETTWCTKPGNFSNFRRSYDFPVPLTYPTACPRCHCSFQPSRPQIGRKPSNEQFVMSIKDGNLQQLSRYENRDSKVSSPKNFSVSPVDSFCQKMSDDSLEKGRVFIDSIFKPQPKDEISELPFESQECSCPNSKIQKCDCGKKDRQEYQPKPQPNDEISFFPKSEEECTCPNSIIQKCECGKKEAQKQAQECQTISNSSGFDCSRTKWNLERANIDMIVPPQSNQFAWDLERGREKTPNLPSQKCVQECQTNISVVSETEFCPCRLHNLCNELKFDLGLESRHSIRQINPPEASRHSIRQVDPQEVKHDIRPMVSQVKHDDRPMISQVKHDDIRPMISQHSLRENLKLSDPKIVENIDSQPQEAKCAINICPCASKKEAVIQKICDSLQKEFCCQAVQTDTFFDYFRENSRKSDIFSQTEYFNEKITRSTSYSSLTSDSHFSIGDLYKYKLYHVMETQTEVKKSVSEPIFKVEKSFYDITLNMKLASKSSENLTESNLDDKKVSWTLSDQRFLKEIEIVENEENSNFPKWTLPDQRTFTPIDVRSVCLSEKPILPEKPDLSQNLSDSEKNLIDEIKNVFGCESPTCVDKSMNFSPQGEFSKDYSVYYNFPDYKKKNKINVVLKVKKENEENSKSSTYINLDSTSTEKTSEEIIDLSSCLSKDIERLKEDPLPHSKYLNKDIKVSVEKIEDLSTDSFDTKTGKKAVYKRFGLEEEFRKIVLPTYLAKKNLVNKKVKTRKILQRSMCDEMTQTLNQKSGFHVKIRSRSTTVSRSRRSSVNEIKSEQKDYEIEAIGKERSDYEIEDLNTDKSANLKTISWKTDDFENLNKIDKDSMKAIMDLLFNLLSPSISDKDGSKTAHFNNLLETPKKETKKAIVSTQKDKSSSKLFKINDKIVKNKRFTMKRQKNNTAKIQKTSSSSERLEISNNKLLKSIMKKSVKTDEIERKFPSNLSVAIQFESKKKPELINRSFELGQNYRKEEKNRLKARSFPNDYLKLRKNKTVLFKNSTPEVKTVPKFQNKLVSADLERKEEPEKIKEEKPENEKKVEPKLKYNTIEGQYEGSSKRPVLLNRPQVKRKSLSLQSQKAKNTKKRSLSFPGEKSFKILKIQKGTIENKKANNHIIDYIDPEELLDERTPWLSGLSIYKNMKSPQRSSKVLWRREARSSVLLDRSENIFDQITRKSRNAGNSMNINEIIYHTNVVPKKSQIEVQICLKEKENKEKYVCESYKKWLTTPSMEYVMNKLKRYPFLRINKFKKWPDSRGDRKSKNLKNSTINEEIKKKSKRRKDLDKCMDTISDLSSIPCTKEELTKRKLEEYLTTLKKLSYKLDDHLNATYNVLREDFDENLMTHESIKVRLNMLERVQKDLWKLKNQIGQTHFLDFHSNFVLNHNQNVSQKLVGLIRMEMDKIINFVKKIDRTCHEVELEKRSLGKKGDCFAWLENQNLIESERKKLSQTKNLLNHKLDEINKLITYQMKNQLLSENATTESEILLRQKLERIGKVLQTELEYIGSLLKKKNS